MNAVALLYMAAETRAVESIKGPPADFVGTRTQVAPTIPPPMVCSPLNALFDEGISWEDADWQ